MAHTPHNGGFRNGPVWHSLEIRDGRALRCVLLFAGFVLVGILFPFRWGGENLDDESDYR